MTMFEHFEHMHEKKSSYRETNGGVFGDEKHVFKGFLSSVHRMSFLHLSLTVCICVCESLHPG